MACQKGVSHLIRSVELTATRRRPTPPDDRGLPDRGLGQRADDPDGGLRGTRQTRTPPNAAKHAPNNHRTKHQHQAPPRATTKRHTARRAHPRALHVHTREERSSGDRTPSHVEGRPELHLILRAWSLTQNHLSYGTVMTPHDAARAQPRAPRSTHSESSLVWNGRGDPRRGSSSTSSSTGWASSGTQRLISYGTVVVDLSGTVTTRPELNLELHWVGELRKGDGSDVRCWIVIQPKESGYTTFGSAPTCVISQCAIIVAPTCHHNDPLLCKATRPSAARQRASSQCHQNNGVIVILFFFGRRRKAARPSAARRRAPSGRLRS